VIQQWLGYPKPKQYCTFVGTRSMLEHTLDRADQIAPPDQKLTIIAQDHQRLGWPELPERKSGRILVQPADRGTATAIFLALTYVRKYHPGATVVIYPSDHFVYPEDRFVELVRDAVSMVKATKHWLILLGVLPSSPEPEYGWIKPGVHLGRINGHRLRIAERFTEKPKLENCRRAMAGGTLWNTLTLASDLALLWDQGWRCLPGMMRRLERFAESIGTSEEAAELAALYQDLVFHDFSSELLQCIPHQIAVLELNGVQWSDWGKSERIVESLRAIGKTPAFSLAQEIAV
jgi:mannose-1-phosphate guanylyltransferase